MISMSSPLWSDITPVDITVTAAGCFFDHTSDEGGQCCISDEHVNNIDVSVSLSVSPVISFTCLSHL